MSLFNNYGNVFWDNKGDPTAAALYKELSKRNWLASDFFIEEDTTNWYKIDAKDREDIIKGFLISNTIKQMFGSVLLPILNTAIDIQETNKRAMMSKIEAVLNGEHSQLNSRIICELNSKIAVKKAIKDIKKMEGLEQAFAKIETIFKGMFGWMAAYESQIPMEGKDLYEELHYHIWKSAAIATVLIEASESLSLASLFSTLEEGHEVPEVLKSVRTMCKDVAIITTYLATIANESFQVISKERQQVGKDWLSTTVDAYFIIPWNESLEQSGIQLNVKTLASDLLTYNLSKSMVKFGFYPESELDPMPEVISKHLGVDINYWIEKGRSKAVEDLRFRWWK